MESRTRIQGLLKQLRQPLAAIAAEMEQHSSWDLSLPVAVIDARREPAQLIPSQIGTINSVLKVSVSIADPLLQRFFSLLESLDLEQAFEICAQDHHSGEAFVEAFEAYRQERQEQGRAMWSLEDSTAFVIKSRDCFADQELPLVAVLPADAEEGAAIFTFGVPLSYFRHALP